MTPQRKRRLARIDTACSLIHDKLGRLYRSEGLNTRDSAHWSKVFNAVYTLKRLARKAP